MKPMLEWIKVVLNATLVCILFAIMVVGCVFVTEYKNVHTTEIDTFTYTSKTEQSLYLHTHDTGMGYIYKISDSKDKLFDEGEVETIDVLVYTSIKWDIKISVDWDREVYYIDDYTIITNIDDINKYLAPEWADISTQIINVEYEVNKAIKIPSDDETFETKINTHYWGEEEQIAEDTGNKPCMVTSIPSVTFDVDTETVWSEEGVLLN